MALTPEQYNKILKLGLAGKLPKRLQPISDPEKAPMAEPTKTPTSPSSDRSSQCLRNSERTPGRQH